MLTLPPPARPDYFPLLSEPLLMLEQLLMNLKVEWAEVAVQTLRSLLVGQEAGLDADAVDRLLADYASRALDFSCAPRGRTRSGQYRARDSRLVVFTKYLRTLSGFSLKRVPSSAGFTAACSCRPDVS